MSNTRRIIENFPKREGREVLGTLFLRDRVGADILHVTEQVFALRRIVWGNMTPPPLETEELYNRYTVTPGTLNRQSSLMHSQPGAIFVDAWLQFGKLGVEAKDELLLGMVKGVRRGASRIGLSRTTLQVELLEVRPEYTSLGVGSLLLREVLDEAPPATRASTDVVINGFTGSPAGMSFLEGHGMLPRDKLFHWPDAPPTALQYTAPWEQISHANQSHINLHNA